MNKINAMVSSMSVKVKPEHRAPIYSKLARSAQRDKKVSYSYDGFLRKITSGSVFYGCYLKEDKLKKYTPSKLFQANWLYVMDFDGTISLEEALKITEETKKDGYKPLLWYTTFNHTEESNRFRIIFKCDNPLQPRAYHVAQIKKINGYYNNLADKRCLYPEKLWQGTHKGAKYGKF